MTLPTRKKKKNSPTIYRNRMKIVIAGFFVIGVIMLIAITVLFGFVSSEGFFSEGTYNYTEEEAQSAIEKTLKTTLPDSVTNPHYFYTSFQDFYLRIRFELPSDDVPDFLDSINHLCFEQPLTNDYMPFYRTDTGHFWWQPFNAERYIGAEQCGNNPYWSIVIDQTDNDISVVYIEAFSV